MLNKNLYVLHMRTKTTEVSQHDESFQYAHLKGTKLKEAHPRTNLCSMIYTAMT